MMLTPSFAAACLILRCLEMLIFKFFINLLLRNSILIRYRIEMSARKKYRKKILSVL
jgi:hypothetical protein